MTEKKLISIRRTLLIWFLVLALTPMILVAAIADYQAKKSLTQAAKEQLTAVARAKQVYLNDWFYGRLREIEIMARSHANIAFLSLLSRELLADQVSPQLFVDGSLWKRLVAAHGKDLIAYASEDHNVHDVLLVDREGHILFTTENENDLGKNIFSGQLAKTLFARSVRTTLAKQQVTFSDMERYVSLDNRLASFLTAPVLDSSGQLIGALAFRINLDDIFEKIADTASDLPSMAHYFVGRDGYLRSELNGDKAQVLRLLLPLVHIDAAHDKRQQHQQSVPEVYQGPLQQTVIGVHHHLQLANVNWTLVSEVNQSDAIARASWLDAFILGLAALTGIVAASLAAYQARHLTNPIVKLAQAARQITAGNASIQVKVTSNNELRDLAEAFNTMVRVREAIEYDLQKNHDELLIAKDEAQSANAAKSNFLANMSHEIRTPMNGVLGMLNLMLENELSSDQKQRAVIAKHSAESLLAILDDILDFSKIEAGKMTLEAIDFDLDTLMEDFAVVHAVRAEEKAVEFICPANPIQNLWLRGDPGRLRQVLNNLVGNAVKFTETGEILVRYLCTQKTADGVALRFEIEDTGVGLTPEQTRTLFERFTQADDSTTRRYGGTGLGLAICSQLVDLMQGEIGVESELGKGSLFWFTAYFQHAETAREKTAKDSLQDERIIAVDDNASNRILLREVFEQWGVQHTLAADGQEALAVMQEAAQCGQPFTIGILDMHMPQMDGAMLGQQIKSQPLLAATKLVLLTSQGQRGDAKRMLEHGFLGYLSKPVNQHEMYQALLLVAGIEHVGDELITRFTVKASKRISGRVLLVEDNATNQIVAKAQLEKIGVYVDIVDNGQACIEQLTKQRYDAIFMDCQMPIMDGYEATRIIRDKHSAVLRHDTPIIAMTANVMAEDRRRCVAVGMDDYVAKPVDSGKLREAVMRWVGQVSEGQAEDVLPTASEPINAVVFDSDAMSQRMMGDRALMQKVAETFLEDIPCQLAALRAAYVSNRHDVAAIAHRIKGAAANVGGLVLSQQASRIETAAQAHQWEAVAAHVEALPRHFDALKAEINTTLFSDKADL